VISAAEKLRPFLMSDPAGEVDSPASRRAIVSVHVGPSIEIGCRRDGRYHRGLGVHGDIDIIPPGTPSRWELKERDLALILSIPSGLILEAATERGADASGIQIVNRFQVRDPRLERLAWAIKAEMENGYRGGKLYFEELSLQLAGSVLDRHSSVSRLVKAYSHGMSGQGLRRVLSYIEDNLSRELSIQEIAGVAGLSMSHCKAAFSSATGVSVHQYVIQRRVERARRLLTENCLSITQVAAATGFTHKSHLAYHTRRAFGVSPGSLRRISSAKRSGPSVAAPEPLP
jgi:AraC family transcriptional regulator